MLEGFNSYNEKAKILTDESYSSGDHFTLTKDIQNYNKGEVFTLSSLDESYESESLELDDGEHKLYLFDEVGKSICFIGSEKRLNSLFKYKEVKENQIEIEEYKHDTTGMPMGKCERCGKKDTYLNQWELYQGSRCCVAKVLPFN